MKMNVKILKLSLATVIVMLGLTASASGPRGASDVDFEKAVVMDRVILSVIENYYDPARIDSLEMFKAVVDALQKAVAEFETVFDEKAGKFTIEIVGKRMSIASSELNSPWSLSKNIHAVFGFIKANVPHKEYDFSELEYLAANAMLAALDPHSNALPPDIYEALRMDTEGEFGGLGIRITTDRRPPCSGNLTVVEVFDNTPASRAGLKKGDYITRIDGESTVNITTSEAADRLRGRPGSPIRIQIKRAGGAVRNLDILRATIPIESVTWKMLDGKVGYIFLEAFQGNSDSEFDDALSKLHEQGMKGLILDLRGNPGGLLDVAIKIADKFLDSGTIVATAGRGGKDSESVRNATPAGTEPAYPLILLVDSSSASAAEIAAGALRNHGRALLVGETTFGKGSVQMVQPIPGGGALKLTSAQYLIPGDISIQAVGVPPDVSFVSNIIDREDMELGSNGLRFSEADLEHHLDRPNTRTRGDIATAVKANLFVSAEEHKADEARFERCYADDDDRQAFKERYEEEFARRLIAESKGTTAEDLLAEARKMVERDSRDQEQSMQKALKKLGVDWSPGLTGEKEDKKDDEGDASVKASAKVVGTAEPGRQFKINVTVKNGSKQTIHRLYGVTKSDNPLLGGYNLVFGKLKPGAKRSWSAIVEMPLNAQARIDPVEIKFEADSGPKPKPTSVDVEVKERAYPRLAYNWQFEDINNKNGLVEPGEEVIMHVTLKNVGKGTTVDAYADLSAKPGIDVIQGRFGVGKLRPGQTVEGLFRLRVSDRFIQGEAELNLGVDDWVRDRLPMTQTLLNREIDLEISPPSPGPEAASGSVTIGPDSPVPLRESPSQAGRKIAEAAPRASFQVDSSAGKFFGVSIDKERHAWILKSDTIPGGTARPKFESVLIEPPEIVVEGAVVRRVNQEKIKIKGRVKHNVRVRDLMVFAGESKLLYLPNKTGSDEKTVNFEVDVDLKPGDNNVVIVARHDEKTYASQPVFIRRDSL